MTDLAPTKTTRVEEPADDDPSTPTRGRWYWVQEDDPWLGCVICVGSNYVELEGPEGQSIRIHDNDFWGHCTFAPNAEEIIRERITALQTETRQLMQRVREVTARLAITTTPSLGSGTETQALAVRNGHQDMGDYKTALVKAKKETLPELFEAIRLTNKTLGLWLGAELIPLKAEAEAMKPAIKAIENRIFSVELYAGLTEQVVQVVDGNPAPDGEKIHLMQRRAYMDEECLARYETGGMEFKDIEAFDAWLARPSNLNRLLPFPRCLLAFRVRRHVKERDWGDIHEFLSLPSRNETDKYTYLYIRNGENLYRLCTEIEFGSSLFPDMEHQKLTGVIYAKVRASGTVEDLITENQWKDKVESEARRAAIAAAAPEEDRWKYSFGFTDVEDYKRYDKDNVYYDDISKHIQQQIDEHNRLVLVLQGLLDRSPVLHPHPQWALWTPEGFTQALVLVYDNARTLVAGDKPDFEAYRKRLNASLRTGSVTVGQQVEWEKIEAGKENDRRDNDPSHRRGSYRLSRYSPYGNEGPGKIARVLQYSPRAKTCTYEWTRERKTYTYDDSDKRIRCTCTMDASKVLNLDAYKPGDFRQFFEDPRTRAEYLEWAPLLLLAEEYCAGNIKPQEPVEGIRRRRTEDGARLYRKRKERKALLYKAVRLTQEVRTRGGDVYEVGTLWRVTSYEKDAFTLVSIDEQGRMGEERRLIYSVSKHCFAVDATIPSDPKYDDK